ncbi:unnamed protein product [Rangifer tarandus platyrhynchus]|uniref:Uncharacterized protein n=1 Tax=Rangifer tarandus platyrhynchus TaxID=3082113 RepID=A0AC59YIA1_RANTA
MLVFHPPSFAGLQRTKTSIQAPLPMVALCSLGCDSPVPHSALASAARTEDRWPSGGPDRKGDTDRVERTAGQAGLRPVPRIQAAGSSRRRRRSPRNQCE